MSVLFSRQVALQRTDPAFDAFTDDDFLLLAQEALAANTLADFSPRFRAAISASSEEKKHALIADYAGAQGNSIRTHAELIALSGKQKRPQQYTSAMVAFYLDDVIAQKLALNGYEKPEDLHVTLALLDDADQFSPDDCCELYGVVQHFAESAQTISGSISGIGRFTSVPDGQKTPLYASVDCPDLPAFRQNLVQALDDGGFSVEMTHGYTPHITLAYLPEDAQLPVETVPELEVQFSSVWLVIGEKRYEFPLKPEEKYSPLLKQASYSDYMAQFAFLLEGKFNPNHGPDGRFAEGDSGSGGGGVSAVATSFAQLGLLQKSILLQQGQQTWQNSLSATEKRAFKLYTTDAYTGINAYLRQGKFPRFVKPAGYNELYKAMNGLDSGLARSELPQDMLLFRGISGGAAEHLWSGVQEGESFTDNGYTSTTLNSDEAHLFSSLGDGVYLTVAAQKGQPGAYIEPYSVLKGQGQYEVLLPRGSAYTVLAKWSDENNHRHVLLRYEGPSGKKGEDQREQKRQDDEPTSVEENWRKRLLWEDGDLVWPSQGEA